jgi:hypothetical protein
LLGTWVSETTAEKREATLEVKKLNLKLEPFAKEQWELSTSMRRINLRRQPAGKKPTWRWNSLTGKLSWSTRGGIDWYRYQKLILLPKLLPFAQECAILRLKTVV